MSFVDRDFAFFLPIFLAAWWFTRGNYRVQVAVMIIGSLVFYSAKHVRALPVILLYCVVDWATGVWLSKARRPGLVLALGVGVNLAVLCFFKYTPLVIETVNHLLGRPAGPGTFFIADNWGMPSGISFFAFSGIAYMVDVYRGVAAAEKSLASYSLFTTFFPHLVAGPILRAKEFLVHLGPGELPDRPLSPWEGTFLIARGLFKKMVIADTIAGAIDPFFVNIADPSTEGVWALPYVYLYALQIYFDFSAYTDIARGLGLWFGFRWPENFNLPYLATSIQEFWRRWHMTLSRFLRDYLYIPLGGNRGGPWRSSLNLMITMLLGGLWHGGSWSFMIWGGLHGLFLIVNRWWDTTRLCGTLADLTGVPAMVWTAIRIVVTFHAVCFAWCFFRLTDWRDSFACIRKWVVFDADKAFVAGSADISLWTLLAFYLSGAAAALMLTRGTSLAEVAARLAPHPFLRGLSWGGVAGLAAIAVLLGATGDKAPFIYFRF